MEISTLVLIGLGAGVLIIAAILVIIGIRSPQAADPLESRLAEFAAQGESVTLEDIELAQPFVERVIYPMARKLGEIALKFTPQNAIQQTAVKLERAGNPGKLDPAMFFALRFLGLPLGGLFLFLETITPPGSPIKGKGVWFMLIGSVLGFYLPDLLLKSTTDRRQKAIRKAMPDALDLLTICVEAGLGFDAAMAKIYEKWDNELGQAFGRVVREIQLGKLRREALRDMADRLGIAEMTSFVAAVIQSEQLGVSMAQVLRIQSDQMRTRRRQLAEEEAHQAPIKMLIPMAFLIFPTLCIVLMAPAIIKMMNSGLGGVL
ncbi:MAG: type II secretion system F family protein [Chloroflexota bacterium]